MDLSPLLEPLYFMGFVMMACCVAALLLPPAVASLQEKLRQIHDVEWEAKQTIDSISEEFLRKVRSWCQNRLR